MTISVPHTPFQDGHAIPQLGYGVWQVEDEVAADVVEQAIRAGYRHIDTAAIYGNEEGVGRAIKAAGVPREELFVTPRCGTRTRGTTLPWPPSTPPSPSSAPTTWTST